MIKIAFFNRKGGTGKSTSVVNIAAVMSKYYDKKVLVLDCDSQRTATKYLLSYAGGYDKTIADCINGEATVEESLVQVVSVDKCEEETKHEIYVLPSDQKMETINLPSEETIKDLLKPLEDSFDFCLFDMPPAINEVALGGLIASDYVIVPAIPDTDSLEGFDELMNTIESIRYSGANTTLINLGVLFNNVIVQRYIQKNVLRSTREQLADLCFEQHIKSASAVEQARYYGLPVCECFPSHEVVTSYKRLVKEILTKIKKCEVERNA